MSILVKGMKMPPNCYECPLNPLWCDGVCDQNDCPLVEIPTPHGRLIDADTMIKEIERWKDHPNQYIRNRNKDFIFYLNDAETVVESEDKECR